ncbi:polyketide cyclase/dehydrase/lipid transport protein [Sphaerotilus hippei]|uniref:Polyketide cyclase/dehydrase/lipid transport protein n=1 Tax=Sphaerotilus hippei TaxID=744406 RepID=A0A318GZF2_9BURK|nr:SRPBCC family protein [Sphaerotilus hippei]PXW95589.1 polyketide cyclase/dehydrase/lipid transport protein [Sphaerotilus hippei]
MPAVSLPHRSLRHRPWPALALLVAAGAAALLSPGARAHGPTRQKVVESVTINAPAATVWALVRPFDALQAWHPAVESSRATQGNEPGSVRTVRLKGGGELEETLETWDDAQMKYSYRLKAGGAALPVTNYSATLRVSADGERCQVEWRGAFYRGYPNNDPPPDQNDEAAVRAVTGVYRAGLDQLRKQVEGR